MKSHSAIPHLKKPTMRPLQHAFHHIILCCATILLTACQVQPTPATTPTEATANPVTNTPSPTQVIGPSAQPEETIQQAGDLNIILGRPTAESIALSFYAQQDMQIMVAYGKQPENLGAQAGPFNLKALTPQTVELNGLSANSAYYYTISSGEKLISQGHSFHTQRPAGESFTFTIDADPHNRDPRFNGELYTLTLGNALSSQPDFHINLGDTFMTEKAKATTLQEAQATFAEMRPYFGALQGNVPLFLVNGNHEGELGWLLQHGKDRELPIWSTQLRQEYYPNPQPGAFYSGSTTTDPTLNSPRDGYYAFTWGDALFVMLDPFWYTEQKPRPEDLNNNWGWTLGKEQYDWLNITLAQSNAKYKFVFIHHLVGGSKDARGGVEFAHLFEWGGQNADGTPGFDQHRPGWGKPIHQILLENHVRAVFHGHDHVFVKQELDGIIYQEMPQPSNAEYNNTRIAGDYGYTSGEILGSSGHLRVTVGPDAVQIAYVRAYLPKDEKPGQKNGQIDLEYSIK